MSRRRPWAGTRSLQAQALDAAHPVPVHGLHRASEEVGDGARVVLILREGIERRSLSCCIPRGLEPEVDSPVVATLHALTQPSHGAVDERRLRCRGLDDTEPAHH